MTKQNRKDTPDLKGVIETWKRDEGYGFIQPNGGGKDYFFHKSALNSDHAPAVGQRVSFTAGRDAKGRLRAENITIESGRSRAKPVGKRPEGGLGLPDFDGLGLADIGTSRLLIFLIPFLITAIAQAWVFLGIYVITSLVGFVLIMQDKRFAQHDMWRIPESTLHVLELVGGWPGSGIAQQIFRHKTRKTSYQVTFWVIAVVHLVVGFDLLLFDLQLSQALLSSLDL